MLWEKEKILVTRIFPFSLNFIESFLSQGHQQLGLYGKGLKHLIGKGFYVHTFICHSSRKFPRGVFRMRMVFFLYHKNLFFCVYHKPSNTCRATKKTNRAITKSHEYPPHLLTKKMLPVNPFFHMYSF